jgi:hypothetical protein
MSLNNMKIAHSSRRQRQNAEMAADRAHRKASIATI